jgi:hypothetical protein
MGGGRQNRLAEIRNDDAGGARPSAVQRDDRDTPLAAGLRRDEGAERALEM